MHDVDHIFNRTRDEELFSFILTYNSEAVTTLTFNWSLPHLNKKHIKNKIMMFLIGYILIS